MRRLRVLAVGRSVPGFQVWRGVQAAARQAGRRGFGGLHVKWQRRPAAGEAARPFRGAAVGAVTQPFKNSAAGGAAQPFQDSAGSAVTQPFQDSAAGGLAQPFQGGAVSAVAQAFRGAVDGGLVRRFGVLAAGGLVLVVAGCSGKPTDSPAPLSSELAATRAACEELGQAYNRSMAPFAEALTGMVSDRAKGKDAQQAMREMAAEVRTATASSGDADLRADGERTADALTARSADGKFFADIRSNSDVENVLTSGLKDWLSPVTRHCT